MKHDNQPSSRCQQRIVGPRVRTVSRSRHEFEGTYKGHTIYIRREHRNDPWYITVQDFGGSYAYDGWWTEPRDEDRVATLREAIVEACKGALLWPNAFAETRER